jgi:6-phosphogluconate dehydrogenase
MIGRLNDIAVIGLGVMGGSLARNLASRGLAVGGYNRSPESAHALAAAHPEAKLDIADDLTQLVKGLERPRRLILLVPAGAPVDATLDALDPLLEDDDIVVDAGNSLFTDTDRRGARAQERPWRFVGMGVSGGEEGALLGPSIMPGGDAPAWDRLRPVLESIAAASDSGPCVTYCGRGSAGHFVKMVHNGIEYGDMQLIAETAMLLRRGLGLPAEKVADVFAEWNAGDLESFLIEITADIFRASDDQRGEGLLLDAVLDRAEQKGTGRWTVRTAIELGVAVPTIAAAVDARVMSSHRSLRVHAEEAFGGARDLAVKGIAPAQLGDALYAAKIASYTQGFSLLAAASQTFDYGTNLAEVARIWKAGCIIRARFLDRVREAFGEDAPPLLALAPQFVADLVRRIDPLRRVVSAATAAGAPVPGLAASLTWLDTLTVALGSANLIQAQRDYFGSHTYERVESPGTCVHSEWKKLARRADPGTSGSAD